MARSRTRFVVVGGPLLALALVLVSQSSQSGANFGAVTANTANNFGTGSLTAPGVPSCVWTGANALSMNWTNTNGTFATGHTVERSNTSGSGFAQIGTTTPASTTTFGDTNPVPPTLRYYRVASVVGTAWTGPYTAEVVSNTCDNSITAFAGGGVNTACSYSGAATGLQLKFLTAASLGSPSSTGALGSDSSGNLYVADTQNNCVRKIDTAGNVTRVAGGGATSTCGTTTASAVLLSSPQGVAVDSSGNAYIADTGANCVRKVSGASVTKFAGGGAVSSCGSTTAANVMLSGPTSVAVDSSGNVYVGDNGNRCVRKIDTSGNVTAVLGNGSSGSVCSNSGTAATSTPLAMIDQIAIGPSGEVYVADGGYSCIYKVVGGTITRIVGKSGAAQASCTFSGDPSTVGYASAYPAGVAVDGSGNVFYSLAQDSDPMNRACVIRLASGTTGRLAGNDGTGNSGDNGPSYAAAMTKPTSLAITPTGDLYVSDIGTQTIRKIVSP